MVDTEWGSRVAGSVFGLAYGDALGAPAEFLSYAEIMRRWDVPGPRELPVPAVAGAVAEVTDDTQMSLAVADALLDARASGHVVDAGLLEPLLRGRFVEWWGSEDNTRAPGVTCMGACAELAAGRAWVQATRRGSKGCGANMRVAPVGLARWLDADARRGAAQLQAALTHGHPTALAASDLTAEAVRALATGTPPRDLPEHLRTYVAEQRLVYHAEWLGDVLWRGPFGGSPEEFAAFGWDECAGVLERLVAGVARGDRRSDPCHATGAGWVAEEALATALLCVLLYVDEPVDALARAVATSGDSDSIASVAGALAGAAYGDGVWPAQWRTVVEYRGALSRVSAGLAA